MKTKYKKNSAPRTPPLLVVSPPDDIDIVGEERDAEADCGGFSDPPPPRMVESSRSSSSSPTRRTGGRSSPRGGRSRNRGRGRRSRRRQRRGRGRGGIRGDRLLSNPSTASATSRRRRSVGGGRRRPQTAGGARTRAPAANRFGSSSSFDVSLFRERLACFVLFLKNRESYQHRYRGERYDPAFPKQIDPLGTIREIPVALSSATNRKLVRRLIKTCLEGAPKRRMFATKNRRKKCSTVLPPLTGREALSRVVGEFSAPELVQFVDEFCSFAGRSVLRELKSCGHGSLVSSLVELFHSGTLPQLRRKEEREVLKGMDMEAMSLSFDLCGVSIPKEIMLIVLSFLEFDYELICSLGCAAMPFYALILSNWDSLVQVRSQTLFLIPELVFRVSRSIKISGQLSSTEISLVFGRIRLEQLVQLNLKAQGVGILNYFPFLSAHLKKDGPMLNLRVLRFGRPSSTPYYNLDETRKLNRYHLVTLAPNLEVVKWPARLGWIVGLQKLHRLALYASQLNFRPCMVYKRPDRAVKAAAVQKRTEITNEILRSITSFEIWGPSGEDLQRLVSASPKNLRSLRFYIESPNLSLVLESLQASCYADLESLSFVTRVSPHYSSGWGYSPPPPTPAVDRSILPTLTHLTRLVFESKRVGVPRALARSGCQASFVEKCPALSTIILTLPLPSFSFRSSTEDEALLLGSLQRIPSLETLHWRCTTQKFTVSGRGRSVVISSLAPKEKDASQMESDLSGSLEWLQNNVISPVWRLGHLRFVSFEMHAVLREDGPVQAALDHGLLLFSEILQCQSVRREISRGSCSVWYPGPPRIEEEEKEEEEEEGEGEGGGEGGEEETDEESGEEESAVRKEA